MTRPARPPSPAVRKLPLRHRIHRTTGVLAGLVLIYLAGTGVPLQWTDSLNLGGRYVTSTLLLDVYGIRPPTSGVRSSDAYFVGHLLFLDRVPVAEADSFQGAVRLAPISVLAAGPRLLLVPVDDPRAAESIRLSGLALRIGRAAERVIIETTEGLRSFDPATFELVRIDASPEPVEWASLMPVEGPELARLAGAARQRVLTLERLLQDLHSGRAFGSIGVWVVNLASLALMVLAATGLWIWWRSR
ncbi:MAG TPA: PepSY domain-containing protein [Pseudomonadales bacterium]